MSDMASQTEIASAFAESGLFDATWYLDRNPDVKAAGLGPLIHYMRYGAAERRQPNRYFDGAWYLHAYPDVEAAGLDPLLHYLRYGDAEGRRPHPYFDAGWYRFAYERPTDELVLKHFLTERTTGRHAPCHELWAVPHLAPYRADSAAGVDPFGHYLDDMARQGQEAFPDLELITRSGLIDASYYLINASDVHEAKLDPVVHYCRFGWREHRRPNIYFDAEWYVETNSDLARLKVNPLVHYLLQGEPANRRPVVYFDPGWYRETYHVAAEQSALAHYLANRMTQTVSPNPLFDVAWYLERYGTEVGRNRDPFAHFLQAGTEHDLDPSPGFDAAAYHRQHMGRPSGGFHHMLRPDQDNSLVHMLRAQYR